MNKKQLLIILLVVISFLLIITKKYENYTNYTNYTKTFTKNINKAAIKKKPTLDGLDSYLLETACLKALDQNFICTCKKKRVHFPKIVNTTETGNNLQIKMTHLGKTLSHLKSKEIKELKRNDLQLEEQIKCILSNLKRAKVYHGDVLAKNLTINTNGDLGLIDFNIAYIDKFKPKTSTSKPGGSHPLILSNQENRPEEFYNVLNEINLLN